MLYVVLIERIVAGNQHHHRLAVGPSTDAARLLPEAHRAARIAGDNGHVERADVDAQLERVGRDYPAQLTAAQSSFDFGTLVGPIARFVGAHAASQLRTHLTPHVEQHALHRHARPPEQDAAVAGPQRLGKNSRGLFEDALVLVGALVTAQWRSPEKEPPRPRARRVAVHFDKGQADHLLGQLDRIADRSRRAHERRLRAIAEPPIGAAVG